MLRICWLLSAVLLLQMLLLQNLVSIAFHTVILHVVVIRVLENHQFLPQSNRVILPVKVIIVMCWMRGNVWILLDITNALWRWFNVLFIFEAWVFLRVLPDDCAAFDYVGAGLWHSDRRWFRIVVVWCNVWMRAWNVSGLVKKIHNVQYHGFVVGKCSHAVNAMDVI